ncbi:MAG: outer membrane lipoprotein-sorting protein [Treponema sp.]|nr:outer membrane lipoprotein-sorting protein [Treponema sp.]
MNKKTFLFLPFVLVTGLLSGAGSLFAEDAYSIVHASRNRVSAVTISTRARMVITAKNGSTTERIIDQYSKDGQGNSRSVIVFQRPQSVAGTRFLVIEKPGSSDDRWIFLPSLGKVRRIAASEGSASFMGTDFSFDDISSANRDADLDTHTLAGEESLNGRPCYVIESRPKDPSYQYSRMVQWIDRETGVNHKLELYDKQNALVKRVEMLDIREIEGRLSPMVTKMTTLASGTSTTLYVDILKYDDPIPESVFTTAYLETGRAR